MRETGPQDQSLRRRETTPVEEAPPNFASRIFARIYYGFKGSPSLTNSESILDESDRE